MSTNMPRLNVYITKEIMQRLKAHAQETGAPTSEIVRRALDAYLPPKGTVSSPRTWG